MILLQGTGLERRFGSEVLFHDIAITIQSNSKIALVGRNGVGKSTLLKILSGVESADAGTITRARDLTLAYMDQNATVDVTSADRSIYDEVASVFDDTKQLLKQAEAASTKLATLDPESAEWQETSKQYDRLQTELSDRNAYGFESEIRMVLSGFQFPEPMWERPVASLSGGQRTRLALAKVLLRKCDLLILDEPTNHLDIDTLTWIESYLQSYQGAYLIVSHDRYFLDKVTNETYEMSASGIERYAGNYSYYAVEREKRFEQRQKQYEKQQKKISELEDYVQKNIVRAATTKMAQSRRKQLEKMTRIEKPKQDERAPYIRFSTERESGNVVIHTDNLAIGYDGKTLAAPIQIDLRKQNALAIVGANGIGKSTLLKTLIKRLPPVAGTVSYGTNVDIGYYDQDLANLHGGKDVLHELWDEHPTLNEVTIRSLLGSFLFTGDDAEKPVAGLSGGEKARLSLAKLALDHDNTLLLDEPTNHLDIDSKEVLENALIAFDGTILFVSHDRYFINRVATAILEIESTGSTLYLGNYDYYVKKKAEQAERARELGQDAADTPEVAPSAQKLSFQEQKERQRAERKLQRRVEELEEHIDSLEQQIAALEEAMARPEIQNDPETLQEKSAAWQHAKTDYDQALADWEDASLALEDF